jgi:alkanesulfonate monooxygenase SsuD/methylene tetrahydromethanopterin reductase-like flavin-dependent oxidoreductase (luciferase family)
VRFGIFDHFELRDEAPSQRYENRLQMIAAADAAGFWCYHKAEHHFTALDTAPSANLLFAAASQRTQHIRLGSLVYLLPFYDPVRLVEEICVLDQLTGGRLEVGIGKGINPVEHELWGHPRAEAKARFDAAFAIVRAGLQEGRLCHNAQHPEAPLLLEPYQARGPGLWYPGNYRYAGEHRLHTILGGPAAALVQPAREFAELCARPVANWNPGVDHPVLGVTRHVYVAPTDGAALERVQRAFPAYHANLISLWRRYDEPLPNDPSLGGDVALARQMQVLVAGAPATVAEHLRMVSETVGTDYLVCAFTWGDLSHAEAMASLQLFVDEVMPACR